MLKKKMVKLAFAATLASMLTSGCGGTNDEEIVGLDKVISELNNSDSTKLDDYITDYDVAKYLEIAKYVEYAKILQEYLVEGSTGKEETHYSYDFTTEKRREFLLDNSISVKVSDSGCNNLYDIVKRYTVGDVNDNIVLIADVNNISNVDLIHPTDVIIIPKTICCSVISDKKTGEVSRFVNENYITNEIFEIDLVIQNNGGFEQVIEGVKNGTCSKEKAELYLMYCNEYIYNSQQYLMGIYAKMYIAAREDCGLESESIFDVGKYYHSEPDYGFENPYDTMCYELGVLDDENKDILVDFVDYDPYGFYSVYYGLNEDEYFNQDDYYGSRIEVTEEKLDRIDEVATKFRRYVK